MNQVQDSLGICQWFHFQDHLSVERTRATLREAGVQHLRTGISWADYHRSGGRAWYDWVLDQLQEFELLLCLWHVPPSISEGDSCDSPPRRLRDFADFVDGVITRYGDRFSHLELWNEPNNKYKWNFIRFDPDWRKFAEMVGAAAYWAQRRGIRTVLGGICPADPAWLRLMQGYGLIEHIDIIAIHAFPGMWATHGSEWEQRKAWCGWERRMESIREAAPGKPVWVTETGFSTYSPAAGSATQQIEQALRLFEASGCGAERVYWYSLADLHPALSAIEGFHVDEHEYHMGLHDWRWRRKPAWHAFTGLLRTASTPSRPGKRLPNPRTTTQPQNLCKSSS